MKRIFVFLGMCLWALSPSLLMGQGIPKPVTFTIQDTPGQVKAGEVFKITVHASIDKGWHLYSMDIGKDGPVPTSFKILSQNVDLADSIKENKPEHTFDPNFNMQLGLHSDSARFVIPVAFSKNVQGDQNLKIQVHYMVCNDRMCLPPTSKDLTKSILVKGVSSKPFEKNEIAAVTKIDKNKNSGSTGGEEAKITSTTEINAYLQHGILSYLWIAITAGLAALLTPCVFPMIPLTVSFFSKNSDGNKVRAVSNALIFGLAIIGTFTLLGLLLALVLGASGASRFASNPVVNLSLGLIFIVFAISLLGLFELRLPYQLTNYLNKKSNESRGMAGILFMGLTISAVSFSCTAPFVGGILAATTTGRWFYPIIGMIGFSTAFAIPFVIFAMFPDWLQSLPKSGEWMNSVKVILGFIELAASFKFLSNADLVWNWNFITRPLTIAAWIVISAMAGFYLLGKIRLKHENKKESISAVKLLLAIPFLGFSLYLIPGLLGSSLGIWDAWLPPKKATDVSVVYSINQFNGNSSNKKNDNWGQNYDSVRTVAQTENKPIFIDFTGYTCTNCRAMEANVFPKEEVQSRFDDFKLLRLYTDDSQKGPKNQRFQFKMTGTVALPTYAIVDPHSGRLLAKWSGYAAAQKFEKFLDKGLQNFQKIAKVD